MGSKRCSCTGRSVCWHSHTCQDACDIAVGCSAGIYGVATHKLVDGKQWGRLQCQSMQPAESHAATTDIPCSPPAAGAVGPRATRWNASGCGSTRRGGGGSKQTAAHVCQWTNGDDREQGVAAAVLEVGCCGVQDVISVWVVCMGGLLLGGGVVHVEVP